MEEQSVRLFEMMVENALVELEAILESEHGSILATAGTELLQSINDAKTTVSLLEATQRQVRTLAHFFNGAHFATATIMPEERSCFESLLVQYTHWNQQQRFEEDRHHADFKKQKEQRQQNQFAVRVCSLHEDYPHLDEILKTSLQGFEQTSKRLTKVVEAKRQESPRLGLLSNDDVIAVVTSEHRLICKCFAYDDTVMTDSTRILGFKTTRGNVLPLRLPLTAIGSWLDKIDVAVQTAFKKEVENMVASGMLKIVTSVIDAGAKSESRLPLSLVLLAIRISFANAHIAAESALSVLLPVAQQQPRAAVVFTLLKALQSSADPLLEYRIDSSGILCSISGLQPIRQGHDASHNVIAEPVPLIYTELGDRARFAIIKAFYDYQGVVSVGEGNLLKGVAMMLTRLHLQVDVGSQSNINLADIMMALVHAGGFIRILNPTKSRDDLQLVFDAILTFRLAVVQKLKSIRYGGKDIAVDRCSWGVSVATGKLSPRWSLGTMFRRLTIPIPSMSILQNIWTDGGRVPATAEALARTEFWAALSKMRPTLFRPSQGADKEVDERVAIKVMDSGGSDTPGTLVLDFAVLEEDSGDRLFDTRNFDGQCRKIKATDFAVALRKHLRAANTFRKGRNLSPSSPFVGATARLTSPAARSPRRLNTAKKRTMQKLKSQKRTSHSRSLVANYLSLFFSDVQACFIFNLCKILSFKTTVGIVCNGKDEGGMARTLSKAAASAMGWKWHSASSMEYIRKHIAKANDTKRSQPFMIVTSCTRALSLELGNARVVLLGLSREGMPESTLVLHPRLEDDTRQAIISSCSFGPYALSMDCNWVSEVLPTMLRSVSSSTPRGIDYEIGSQQFAFMCRSLRIILDRKAERLKRALAFCKDGKKNRHD